jgi:DNA-binding XRE family transcriptional regulator
MGEMFTCTQCQNNVEHVKGLVTNEFSIPVDDKDTMMIVVIEDIQSIKCSICGYDNYDKEANEHIDKQMMIFKEAYNSNDKTMLHNRLREIAKSKGWTQERLGECIGVSKQRVFQLYTSLKGLDITVALKLSHILDTPMHELFKQYNIVEKDGKWYIE